MNNKQLVENLITVHENCSCNCSWVNQDLILCLGGRIVEELDTFEEVLLQFEENDKEINHEW